MDDELLNEDEDMEDDVDDTTDAEDEDDDLFEIPFDVDELDDIEEVTRTYKMDFRRKRIGGKVDGVEAIGQAAWKILQARRFAFLIYDDQYGNDLFNKINVATLTPAYIESEVPRMVEEALKADSRILEVLNFKWEKIDDVSVHVEVEIRTSYGQVALEGVIENVD